MYKLTLKYILNGEPKEYTTDCTSFFNANNIASAMFNEMLNDQERMHELDEPFDIKMISSTIELIEE